MTDRVVNSALKYRTQIAFVDGLIKDLGLPIGTAGSAGALSFRDFMPPPRNPMVRRASSARAAKMTTEDTRDV